jgi:hypothetical protein
MPFKRVPERKPTRTTVVKERIERIERGRKERTKRGRKNEGGRR